MRNVLTLEDLVAAADLESDDEDEVDGDSDSESESESESETMTVQDEGCWWPSLRMPGDLGSNAFATSAMERSRMNSGSLLPPLEAMVGNIDQYMGVMDQYLAIPYDDLVTAPRHVFEATASASALRESKGAANSHEVQDPTIATILSSNANVDFDVAVGQEAEGHYGN